ncbi:cyclic di-GMP phosphodiesterase response regulator RpfG [mine drainage metagenome]|uniref:Cyclic di-GMP phosphodiesterase response regulator RpfG n=1 Tax=mine drainage metagenome TaxID=410659 RepID=A0A1J5R0N1_9ZZZZ
MIKRIRSEQLRPGMYIHDLNRGWMGHTFLFNAFRVDDEKTIEKIVADGIREIYIDTSKGLDVEDAQTQDEHHAELHHQMMQMFMGHGSKHIAPVPFEDEMDAAVAVHKEANHVVHTIMEDIRLGKQIETEKITPVVENITDSIFRNQDALIALSRIKHKDDYTFQHSVSVCALLVAFCRAMGYERKVILQAGIGGLLHDIGKMKVPSAILNKPGALTDEEFEVMKSHSAIGRDLLNEIPGMPEIAVLIAGQHHERFDGAGYPDKLKGDEISQFGQLASIVDVYDALTSHRIYHKGIEPAEALKKLFEWSRFHFNGKLVQHFIRTVGIYPTGTLVALESGFLGVVVKPGQTDLLHPVVRIVFDSGLDVPVIPRDVDLSRSVGKGGGDRIVRNEHPEKWGIDPYKYLLTA